MTGRLVAGVDCSTQATKVIVVDPDDGRIVATGRAPHTVTGTDGARETDPREWWTALRTALAETGRAGDIAALSVAGQQHGLVVLDAAFKPVRDAILWNDTRSAAEAERLTARLGAERWADRTGLRPVASFTVSKWAWLRAHEPASVAAARAVRLPHDYLTERLTGRATTDRGDASGTGWWSSADEAYADDILGLAEIDLEARLLPSVLGSDEAAGGVPAGAAAELGLAPGTIVGPGTGDNMAAALAMDLAVGQPVLSLGTSGTVYAVSERRATDPTGVVAGFADASGRFLPLACTLNCTLAVDRTAEWLGLGRDDVSPAESVVVLPWLDGERTPDLPGASGTIVGLRHSTTPQQILMATYEGAVASLLEALAAVESASADSSEPLVLIGGGARGATWREVVRRLSGRSLLIPAAEELVAIGAAVQATAILRGEAPSAVARQWQTLAGLRLEPVARDDGRVALIAGVRNAIEAEPAFSGARR